MYKAPRGTSDILPEEQQQWNYVKDIATTLAKSYGYGLLETPIFENTNLFSRGIGQTTDVVEKEMYSFEDRGGESITLRPEGTAPVCRAYLEHGMHNLPQPVRMFYLCPIFRYERPQSGRYREHHQFGVECIGDIDPSIDAEIIVMAWSLMKNLGLADLSLLINTIGDSKCRPSYIDELKLYYSGQINKLCSDCKNRLSRNALRLLDCKKDGCIKIADKAPHILDHLCSDCLDHWHQLIGHLDYLGIPYTVNRKLVRGFDYYTRTVFEIQPAEEGAQSNICGGGRYDGLMEQIGGPPTPGIGFGVGIERLIINLERQNVSIPVSPPASVLVAHIGDEAKSIALMLSHKLRQTGIDTILGPSGRSLRAQMRYVNSANIPFAIIIGEQEIQKNVVVLRDMTLGEQTELTFEDAVTKMREVEKA